MGNTDFSPIQPKGEQEECSSFVRFFVNFRDSVISFGDRFGTPGIIDLTTSQGVHDDRMSLLDSPSSSTPSPSSLAPPSSSSSPSSSLIPFSEIASSWIAPLTLREQLKNSKGLSSNSNKVLPRIIEAKHIVVIASTLMFVVISLTVALACHFRTRYCKTNVPTISYAVSPLPLPLPLASASTSFFFLFITFLSRPVPKGQLRANDDTLPLWLLHFLDTDDLHSFFNACSLSDPSGQPLSSLKS
jgi:hypothetical protein